MYKQLLARITIDPAVCHGQPCIRGHTISVGLALGLLEAGMSEEHADCPSLPDDIRACLACASELTRLQFADSP